ncbi:MAG: 4-(cytidine 5'-diphospho)-2-C-methyl-D-erythritol kinase [Lentimicrobiaceae bacterium]
MIVFPNGKINLGLRVVRKRTDSYHDISSYMIPISLSDALEMVPSPDTFHYTSSGLPVGGTPEENLCVKAFRFMQKTYDIAPVNIHLHKVIPLGAGLGGGSSDATFALSLLRRLFDLKFCNNELETMAGMLGSDCPFFVDNKAQLIEARGTPARKFLHLPDYHIVVVVPPVAISTSWAYSHVIPSGEVMPDEAVLLNHEDNWRGLLVNDFEAAVFKDFPVIERIKAQLYDAGAFYASMSGSGSAVYGLFKEQPDCRPLFKNLFVWEGKLLT